MKSVFYFSGVIAVIATIKAMVHVHPLYSLLYLIVSLLAIACSFFSLGAYFAGALEIIIYAGAIMVLFIFLIMMLNTNTIRIRYEFSFLSFIIKLFAFFSSILLLLLLIFTFLSIKDHDIKTHIVDANSVGILLFGPYFLVVEIASMLLLGGLIVVLHFGRDERSCANLLDK